jgi:hypothetical protein
MGNVEALKLVVVETSREVLAYKGRRGRVMDEPGKK